jgi:hypothetical protein
MQDGGEVPALLLSSAERKAHGFVKRTYTHEKLPMVAHHFQEKVQTATRTGFQVPQDRSLESNQ